jgi:hypothetical protein
MPRPLYPKEGAPGGWMGPRAGLDVVEKRENPIIAAAENLTPVVQPVYCYVINNCYVYVNQKATC